MLTSRQLEIFKAIVDEYIRSAEPVGSRTLQQRFDLQYSSATIRNEMQALEEMGYLEKTHTSSGRIPSTLGYKFYCENLLENSRLDSKMELAIRKAFDATTLNLQDAIQESCRVLSEMTNMTTGAIGPDASSQRLEHIKLFPIDERNAVCVFITSTGHTETKSFHFEDTVSFQDIENCTDILNARLKGILLCDLVEAMQNLRSDLASQVKRHEMLFTAFVQAFVKFTSDTVYFSGKNKLLYQPEFEDINKLKKMMSLLDDSSAWRQIGQDDSALVVKTNDDTELTWINDMTVVRSTFHINDGESGQLMVVGPSRMNYDKVIMMIRYAASMIEKMYRNGAK